MSFHIKCDCWIKIKERESLPNDIKAHFTLEHSLVLLALASIRMLNAIYRTLVGWYNCTHIYNTSTSILSMFRWQAFSHGTYEKKNLCNAFGNNNLRDRKIEWNKRRAPFICICVKRAYSPFFSFNFLTTILEKHFALC